jgi:uncharacterized SAM-binding protein YcdF (DUF218 family)
MLEKAITERLQRYELEQAGKMGFLLEPVNLIAVLAGDKPNRHALALKLLKEQPRSYITVTGMHEEIDCNTVSSNRILHCQNTRTTYEDSLAIKGLIEKKGFNSVAVVTSKMHYKRAALTIKKTFAGSSVRVIVVCSPDPPLTNIWDYFLWTIGNIREFVKTLYYLFKRRL